MITTTLRPTLSDIITRIRNDAESRLTKDELKRSDLNVFIRVIAGASHGIYAALDFYKDQLFSDSAESSYLERRGAIFNLSRRTAARASGKVTFEYYNDVVDVPVGTLLQSSDNLQYKTTQSPSSAGVAPVRAVLGGEAYNLAEGESLSLVNPVEGVKAASVTTAISGGTEAESDEDFRARILARTQDPPRQGTKADYIAWAQEVEGVGQAWCFPKEMGDGSVTVRLLTDDDDFPDSTLLANVKKHIESKASILATIYVESPIAQACDLTLKITPDTTAVRQAAETALAELFRQESEPGGTIYLSHINACLSSVADETDHVIVSPTSDFVAASNSHLLTLGSVTWQS